ncbi:choice-of-anchor Q domain-containing protein [Flaviaesturariibacter amylovorans]|uniref:Right-handed parallel beta-helix repeat-containing protein n=1 Tax=Flaviaesturariibacter amylovorans TaxID=1084520 RepID=A0ABP8G9T4_9BACT
MKPVLPLLCCLLIGLGILACRKDRFTTSAGAQLRTSVDTLHFDTVFTTVGSVSGVVKIFNDDRDGIRISSVRLAGGAASPFRINVDGIPGPQVRDLEVAGNDSLYIFVTVTLGASGTLQPFVVQDSIEISWNGNRRWVQLDAWGQNARFLRNHEVTGSETWDSTLPYVILDRLTIDTGATLSLTPGTRLYMHANAPIVVHGSLQAAGEPFDSTRVLFTGDRLDVPYRDFPASWPGIYFSPASRNNRLTAAWIRNAYQGVVLSGGGPAPKVILEETIIDNAYDAGLLAGSSSLSARNLLVSNCGRGIVLEGSGDYSFVHCTAAGYSNGYVQHKEPVLGIYTSGSAPFNALFRNCIFWGEANGIVQNEVELGRSGTAPFNLTFDQVLWRVRNAPSPATTSGAINNTDPQFDSVASGRRYFSFRLAETSPALNKGVPTTVTTDLDGKPRPVGLPDLGAYERQ